MQKLWDYGHSGFSKCMWELNPEKILNQAIVHSCDRSTRRTSMCLDLTSGEMPKCDCKTSSQVTQHTVMIKKLLQQKKAIKVIQDFTLTRITTLSGHISSSCGCQKRSDHCSSQATEAGLSPEQLVWMRRELLLLITPPGSDLSWFLVTFYSTSRCVSS